MAKKDLAEDVKAYTVTINGREHAVVIDGNQATVDGRAYSIKVTEGIAAAAVASTTAAPKPSPAPPRKPAPAAPPPAAPKAPSAKTEESVVLPPGAVAVEAPMAGVVLEIHVEAGQSVSEGDILLTLEAMKMEIEIVAAAAGTVSEIGVAVGAQVQAMQVVMVLN